jgi:hypothetical protein
MKIKKKRKEPKDTINEKDVQSWVATQYANGGKAKNKLENYNWAKDEIKTKPIISQSKEEYQPYMENIDVDAYLKAQQLLGDGVSFFNPLAGRIISAGGDVNDLIKDPKNPLNYITPVLPTISKMGFTGKFADKIDRANMVLTGLTTISDLPKELLETPKKQNGGSTGYKWSDDKSIIKPIIQPQNNVNISQTIGNRKLTPKEVEANRASMEAYNKNRIQEEYNDRKNKIQESIQAQSQPLSLKNLQTQSQSTGDKLSLAMNSKYGNPEQYPTVSQYVNALDYLNPAKFVGDMASGLGSVPQDIKEGNYLKAGLSVATPLTVGALAGIGANSTKQFANNLVNPLAGTGDIVNNLGNKYLPNAHKLNPFAFKPNSDAYYRGIGRTGLDDALESGYLRAKNSKLYGEDVYMSPNFGVAKGNYSRNKSIFEGDPFGLDDSWKEILPKDGKSYIAEIPKNKLTNPEIKGAVVAINKGPLPIDDVRLLKQDWLKGYKQVEVPKTTQNFKSEIDNIQFNISKLKSEKELYEKNYQSLVSKYKNKEITPEQYKIEYQKIAPENPYLIGDLEKQVRELKVKQDIFNTPQKNILTSETQLGKNISDGGSNNKGVFELGDNYVVKLSAHGYDDASRLVNYADKLTSPRIMKTHQVKEFNGKVYQVQDKATGIPYTQLSEQQLKNLPKNHIDNFYKDIAELEKNGLNIDISGGKSNIFYDSKKGFQFIDLGIGKMPNINDVNKVVAFKNGGATGNNGMFDMTNPNIYKALVPGVIGLGAASQIDKKQNGGSINEIQKYNPPQVNNELVTQRQYVQGELDNKGYFGYGGSVSYKDFKKKYKDV